MTDPQNDIPCTACEVEGPPARLDDDGLCRRCRVPHEREADTDLHRLPTEVPDAR